MNKPIIANIKPTKVSLTEGKDYYFCQCGRSQNQPYCDGSHAVTDITPMPYKAIESRDAFLCQCKHSSNFPFCDGTTIVIFGTPATFAGIAFIKTDDG